jgi:RNA polymerase sigma-70 factor (ECF subfamily)
MGEVDDVGLLERAHRGDEDAFSQLFTRHQRVIYRYAVHMCGRDAADDIVQETFLGVLRQVGRYEASRGAVLGYLLGIARHLVVKRLTSRKLGAFDEELDENMVNAVASDHPTPIDALTKAESVERVRTAIESLPPTYREVLVLCELEEMDYVAVAEIAQCPVGTVRSRLHRAKRLLAAKLVTSASSGRKD